MSHTDHHTPAGGPMTSSTDLDSTPESGTMGPTPGEATVAIEQHQHTTAPEDPHAAWERAKDTRARHFLIYAACVFVVGMLIMGTYVLTRDEPTATPVATGPSTADIRAKDEAAALKTLQAYNTASDKALRTAKVEGSGLEQLVDYNMLQDAQAFAENQRNAGITRKGNTTVEATVTAWAQSRVDVRQVTVRACLDGSKTGLYDATGQVVQNTNPDGSPDKRTRKPATYYIEAADVGGNQTRYTVVGAVRDPSNTATC